jgi:hypothetical protein
MSLSLTFVQIAFALGGKVYGNGAGVVAPGRDRPADDCSINITANQAGDGIDIEPAGARDYVEAMIGAARDQTTGKLDFNRPRKPAGVWPLNSMPAPSITPDDDLNGDKPAPAPPLVPNQ